MCPSDSRNTSFPSLPPSLRPHLNDLVTEPQSAVPGREAAGGDVVNEDLGVSLRVLVLVTESEAQHLPGITRWPPQLNLLKITISVIIVLRFT